jgi:hypothetical protein
MTTEEQVQALEDAVINLSNTIQRKFAVFEGDVDPNVVHGGILLREWAESVTARRTTNSPS